MATILVTHGVPLEGFSALSAHHTLLVPAPFTAFSRDELLQMIPDVSAIVACGKIDSTLIRAAGKLQIIANYGSGYDAVDVVAAASCGIPVTNIPEITAHATAELAVGLMLAVSRRIGEMNLRVRAEAEQPLFAMGCEMGHTLQGKQLAIIGMGRIGHRVAHLAEAFGMQVRGLRRHDVPAGVPLHQAVCSLVSGADMVSLHCPLNDETQHLLNAQAIACMKHGAIVINTSRGTVIDCDALADALATGHLGGAGLDVYPNEPEIPQRLKQLRNVVLTPHVGTNTTETRFAMAQACANQILDALHGVIPKNVVNGVQQLRRMP